MRALLPGLIAGRSADGRQASLIVPRLYLASYYIASKPEELQALGITHVLSVLDFAPEELPPNFKRLHIKLQDTSSSNILQYLEVTTEFIKSALEEDENNKVLVHCLMGISRSATVVCAYLIATAQMTPDEALDFVMQKRSIACPNLGFRLQLETYASRFNKSTVVEGAIAKRTRSQKIKVSTNEASVEQSVTSLAVVATEIDVPV
ncbi:DSPc-domain-containing protein [Trametopsis cervina]|nr:DSPc-domain-containing protein [Trametopsis cervina]